MPDVITNNLDLWSSALLTKSTAGRGSNGKQEIYGIKKLRGLILELAVRGKLVPQDPDDEPASELLNRITTERTRLVKEGQVRKKSVLPHIGEDEAPYVLPDGWEWTRLGQIVDISSGDGLISANMNSSGEIPVYGGNGVTGYHDKANVTKRTLVIGRVGYYCGSIHITPASAWVTDNAFVTDFSEENIYLDFLYWLLKGTNLKEDENATAQPVISGRKIYPIVIGLPPKEEQRRIVAKVDELMALCDQLEQQQSNNVEAHQALVETLLGTLTNVASQQELNEAWNRIADHFDILFTTEQSIDQLKQTILQLAVMGKLVPQDPNDEPASFLLAKIKSEKERLTKEKKIRKSGSMPAISADETPYELPRGWEWVKLENLCEVITKGSSPKWQGINYVDDSGVLFVTSENVGSFELRLGEPKYVEKKFNEIEPRSILKKFDILMNIVGASIGRTAIFDIEAVANINQAVCLIRFIAQNKYVDLRFMLYFFNSYTCVSYMFDKQVDNARANLSMGNISKFAIPLPPLVEQHRIVAKVDELMALCDTLKSRLNESQTTQIHLADAIVEQAVA